mmetsp:Transcript_46266/g.134758  ORF Transcript_46266/g.134758 Transcript_46266/m.134758 type:complete len:249 (-) Transcript_46266:641-1387(-)
MTVLRRSMSSRARVDRRILSCKMRRRRMSTSPTLATRGMISANAPARAPWLPPLPRANRRRCAAISAPSAKPCGVAASGPPSRGCPVGTWVPRRRAAQRQSRRHMPAKPRSSPGYRAEMSTCAAKKSASVTTKRPFQSSKMERTTSSAEHMPDLKPGCSNGSHRCRKAATDSNSTPSMSRSWKMVRIASLRASFKGPCNVVTTSSPTAPSPAARKTPRSSAGEIDEPLTPRERNTAWNPHTSTMRSEA